MNKFFVKVCCFIKDKSKENEHHIVPFGLLTIIGYLLFYFINTSTAIGNYDNIALRLLAAALALPLIFKKFWPSKIKWIFPFYWYASIIYILPFFFTFMLLKNNFHLEWQLNAIIILTLVILLFDWLSVIFVAIIGVSLGILFYQLLDPNPQYHLEEVTALINASISLLVYCVLFGGRTQSIQNERRIRLELTEKLNSSLEQKVSERTEELERALKSKTEFLNNISHEVRTPIVGVEGISNGLVDHWDKYNDNEKYEYAKKVAKNATRLRSLVGNLLDLSKFTSGKMVLDIAKMNFNNVINLIIQESKELYIQDKPISIKFNSSYHKDIFADEERISQVLRNLFVNAIKFSPIDKKTVITAEVNTIKYLENEAVEFRLSDQGIGIPENELEDIFEPFTQGTKTKTKAGGTGLGLAICKEIIESHGGKIWAEHNNEGGASLTFIIPVKTKESIMTEHNPKSSVLRKRRPNILIIDDEDSCLTSMGMILLSGNYNIIEADDGHKGIEIIRNNYNDIDLILLDLMMPDIYGLEVLKAIKSDQRFSHIPVILQTGTSQQDEINQAYELGLDGYIKKPYNKENVLTEISKIVG